MSWRGLYERCESLREALEVSLELTLVLALVAADQVLVLPKSVVTPASSLAIKYDLRNAV